MLRTEVIRKFLETNSLNPFAKFYNHDMEVQVNVARDDGDPVQGEYQGKRWQGFTNGAETWKPFRIPRNAKTEPEYVDSQLTWNIDHAEGIGMTGWNWKERRSYWVAFDFDSAIGHSDKHQQKLQPQEIETIRVKIQDVSWVTLLKSTSGHGLHLYVQFEHPPETSNHTEHAALARSILSLLSAQVGHDFAASVDICGGNMWVWHRKCVGTEGFKTLKLGTPLKKIPDNWKEHVPVITRRRNKIGASFVETQSLLEQRPHIKLQDEHLRLIKWLSESSHNWWWDSDNSLLVTHTYALKCAHTELGFNGPYETLSEGKDAGDHNCFLFPLSNGGWTIRRFGLGTKEHNFWFTDEKNWTKTYFNCIPDLEAISRLYGAIETEKGAYVFKSLKEHVVPGLRYHRLSFEELSNVRDCSCTVKLLKNGKLSLSISIDPSADIPKGWFADKANWKKVVPYLSPSVEEKSVDVDDDLCRHIVSATGEDMGWVLNVNGQWRSEPLTHVRTVLSSKGHNSTDISAIIGDAVLQGWRVINQPFQPEYPGDRIWNRRSARFRVLPSTSDSLNYKTWKMLTDHVGAGLDADITQNEWCKTNGIHTGGHYLTLWLASLLKAPQRPLPYLFLWGVQKGGKSLWHEAIKEFLVERGVIQGNAALLSSSAFNAELEGMIMVTVDEVNLSKKGGDAYNRIKEWVTSPEILIHAKGQTPYSCPNYTHWIQTANSPSYCPIFEGDTRVTMIQVGSPENPIPKEVMRANLQKEAGDFLAYLLSIEIPASSERLALPALDTLDKIEAMTSNMSDVSRYIHEQNLFKPGHVVKVADFVQNFQQWILENGLPPMTTHAIGKHLKATGKHPVGRMNGIGSGMTQFYGNLSFDRNAEPRQDMYTRYGEVLLLARNIRAQV